MKVLFINTVYTGFSGGGPIDTKYLSNLLRKEGVEVGILHIKGGEKRYAIDWLLSVLPVKLFSMRTWMLDSLIRLKMIKYVEALKPDIIDIQEKSLMSAAAGHDIAEAKKVFNIIEEFSSETGRILGVGAIKGYIFERKRRHIIEMLKNEEHLVSNSESSKQILIDNGIDSANVEVIYRSLPPAEWYNMDCSPVEFNSNRKIHFLAPGRISKEKGVVEIVNAMIELNKEGHSNYYDVTFVGGGKLKPWLISMKERHKIDNLSIKEPVPIENMFDIYINADMVLLPVLHEDSFPRVALESLICGRPLLTTLRGGIKEAANCINGSYIEVKNCAELEDAMRRLIKDPEIICEMSRKIVAEKANLTAKFNHRKMINKYIEYYENVVSGN